jgi:hypothetical protein
MSQAFLIQLLLCLGLCDKPSKCTLPLRVVPFIGFLIDFPKCLVSISPEQALAISQDIWYILSCKWVSPSSLRTLVGGLPPPCILFVRHLKCQSRRGMLLPLGLGSRMV